MKKILLFVGLVLLVMAASNFRPATEAPKMLLSEYGFFAGKLADLAPADRVFPYEVNAPLFSDYADKARFIYLPPGARMQYDSARSLGFPTGAAIIKNFYYPHDPNRPEAGRRILETRLLLLNEKGWKALTYIWNDTQTDATLEVAGAALPFDRHTTDGTVQHFDYQVPNVNQCKGCHSYDGQFTPIGTTVRQLNRGEGTDNQLLNWQKDGLLDLPAGFLPDKAPRLYDYRTWDHLSANAPAAARAYLDGNCSHCHNPHGPASTSGMFLGVEETNLERLGVGKPPVAAGRGSGNRRFGIVPGKPQESILVYRMESNDPGIRMPELGRQLEHREGLEIVKAWIRGMQP